MSEAMFAIQNFILSRGIGIGTFIVLVVIAALVLVGMIVAISIKNRAKEQAGSLKNIEDHLSKIDVDSIEKSENCEDTEHSECVDDNEDPEQEDRDVLAAVSEAMKTISEEDREEMQETVVREYNIGKSGKIYTKEELEAQIKF